MTHRTNGTAPRDKLLPLLNGVVENGQNKWKACCPIHEADGQSHSPSLEITEKPDGTLLLHCFPCGPEVRAARFCHAVGLTMSDLYADHGKRPGRKDSIGKKVADYVYRDAQGCIAYRAERWMNGDGAKTFTQSRPNGQGGWVPGVKGIERVPYRLPELIASAADGATVFIVEGEKKVEALVKWGLVATCNVGGAGKWNKEFSTRYLNGRDVVILPDNDPLDPETGRSPGFDHAAKVLECTKPVAKSVRVIELPGLPPKGDVIDWIDAGGTLSKLLAILSSVGTSSDATALIESRHQAAAATVQQMSPLDLRLPEAMTDLANARRLVQMHGKNLRWCQPWKAWIVWDGKRWRVDQTLEVERLATAVSDWLWEEMRRVGKDVSDTLFQKVSQFVKHSSNRTPVEKMLATARGLPECKISPDEFDCNPMLLNVANGTIDLSNGELQPHNQTDLITQLAPTTFDIDAACPDWKRFLLSTFGSDELVEYVQRLCGYWLTGVVREQFLPILWGAGSNGKTTFLNAIMEVLGSDYAMKAPLGFLMVKKERHLTEKADLFGKRLVVCSETSEGRPIDEALMKEITGNEPLRVRRLYENLWEFKPTHKIALVTNHMPSIRGTDHGVWRRIRKVSFAHQFWNPDLGETGPENLIQDKTLGDRLKAEYSGILTWMIRGCIKWLHYGEQAPTSVSDCTADYRQSQDLIGIFLEECCTVPGTCIRASKLYKCYEKWADDNGERKLTGRQFGLAMTDRKFDRKKSSGVWYHGLHLAENSDY